LIRNVGHRVTPLEFTSDAKRTVRDTPLLFILYFSLVTLVYPCVKNPVRLRELPLAVPWFLYSHPASKIERQVPKMKKYVCTICGYVYDEAVGDPDNGVAPGTKWEDVPEDWVCPDCGVGKSEFELEA